MTIKETHDWIRFLLDKNKEGYHSHEEIDRALDMAGLDVFNDYFGNPKMHVPISGYGEHQAVNKVLSPFKEALEFTNVDTVDGILALPVDFVQPIAAYTTIYSNTLQRSITRPVQPINEDELVKRLESQMIPVNTSNPIAVYNKDNMQLYPPVPQAGKLFYFRRPAKPHYAYTMVNRVETHDPGTSVDPEWDDTSMVSVVAKALIYLGANLSSEMAIQFGDMKDKQGA